MGGLTFLRKTVAKASRGGGGGVNSEFGVT